MFSYSHINFSFTDRDIKSTVEQQQGQNQSVAREAPPASELHHLDSLQPNWDTPPTSSQPPVTDTMGNALLLHTKITTLELQTEAIKYYVDYYAEKLAVVKRYVAHVERRIQLNMKEKTK